MEKIKIVVIIHVMLTMALLQVAIGVNLIYDFGVITYGIATIIPCIVSFINFYTSIIREEK